MVKNKKSRKILWIFALLIIIYIIFFLYSNIDLSKQREMVYYEKFNFGNGSFINYGYEIFNGTEPIFLNRSQDTVVLLLHGMGGTPIELEEMAHFLGDKNISVVVPLMLNQGRDYDSIKKLDGYEEYLQVEEIHKELNKSYENVFIGGLSTGGSLSLKLGEKYNLSGIISLATPIIYGSNFLGDFTFYFFKTVKFISPSVRRIEYGLAKDPSVAEKLPSFDRLPLSVLLEGEKLRIETRDNIKKINSPIIILQSSFDNRAAPASAQYIFDNVNSENKKLVYLNNSGHVITMDYDKEIVFDEVYKFISQNKK
jgi:carboxylesterase